MDLKSRQWWLFYRPLVFPPMYFTSTCLLVGEIQFNSLRILTLSSIAAAPYKIVDSWIGIHEILSNDFNWYFVFSTFLLPGLSFAVQNEEIGGMRYVQRCGRYLVDSDDGKKGMQINIACRTQCGNGLWWWEWWSLWEQNQPPPAMYTQHPVSIPI